VSVPKRSHCRSNSEGGESHATVPAPVNRARTRGVGVSARDLSAVCLCDDGSPSSLPPIYCNHRVSEKRPVICCSREAGGYQPSGYQPGVGWDLRSICTRLALEPRITDAAGRRRGVSVLHHRLAPSPRHERVLMRRDHFGKLTQF
jgi:hypothetical protein